ncbi:phosphate ABC transporter ATP-binding protein PstB [Mycolicibacterium poriferae]|uniref:Phosphate import ATP-binding protein PstB n=1 Tax=Mycolicibacterium poriferae TaxID=39694 RepID=A0A6N4VHV0_9MYCO|nr:phosphate ABC transporter ATP-binding protein PstB [Mycolicibacterium poriferae]MCV7261556.1 phosphate ABC transporter ATP-binding protein [Mycolicibacterium poriferae]BBX53753.1 phosphate import ATP-binding protein PstB [Mycolicibacterium poriferae]
MTDKTTAPATHQTEEEERPAVQALPSVEETARESREQRGEPQSETERETLFAVDDLTVRYGKKPAVEDVTFDIYKNNITALIGPSGCGKSTLIRCFNRMNDLIPAASIEGHIRYHGQDLYDPAVDAVEVRKRIGMVFQAPNPFPKSIFENIAFGPRVLGTKKKSDLDDIVEEALTRAALWDDVKDRLDDNAYGMSGGQQQRLCIARSIATKPDVVLMDEPCSALDPISTGKIEDLMMELKKDYSIIVVTHNMQQAARVSDMTAFLMVQLDDDEENPRGRLVEYNQTDKIFTNPADERTEQYVSGRVG